MGSSEVMHLHQRLCCPEQSILLGYQPVMAHVYNSNSRAHRNCDGDVSWREFDSVRTDSAALRFTPLDVSTQPVCSTRTPRCSTEVRLPRSRDGDLQHHLYK